VVAAVLAAFALVTSGTSVSFAAGHLGLPGMRGASAETSPQTVALCIRASDPAVVEALPGVLASHNATASFFLPADVLEAHRELLTPIQSVGNIQNGGTAQAVSRLSTPFAVRRAVTEGSEEVRGATGHLPAYYLPSRGPLNPAAYLAATSAHERGVVGTHWIRTGKGALKHLSTGDVVVLDLSHSTPDRAPAMLSKFLDGAAAGGLKVVNLASAPARID
jgi:peptidoglycan/xylan/chitin deacetylase (PgdA/CDA1 family)